MSIKAKIAKAVAKQVFLVKKESPALLFVGGVASLGASTAFACKATLKLDGHLQKLEKGLYLADQSLERVEDYTEKNHRRDTLEMKIGTAAAIAKDYAPAVVLAVVGIAALTGSQVILHRRNVALTAAYKGLEQSYKAYRQRVREEVGEEKEAQLHYEAQDRALSAKNADGSPSKKRKLEVKDGSIYSRYFDPSNPNWEKIPEYNRLFLEMKQQYLTNRLQARGFMFLNDVYKELSLPPSKAGQQVGWWIEDPNSDGCVDFGIFRGTALTQPAGKDYKPYIDINNILLDFNVDGYILDKFKD